MSYKLTVQYEGGSGFHAIRDTLDEVYKRLDNIVALDAVGSVVVTSIEITRVNALGEDAQ